MIEAERPGPVTQASTNPSVGSVVGIAGAGWVLASFDFNVLWAVGPGVAQALHLGAAAVSYLDPFVDLVAFGLVLLALLALGRVGCRALYLAALAGSGVFTAAACVAPDGWAFAVTRAVATGCALAVLGGTVGLWGEQLPRQRRTLFTGVILAGWPLGLFLALGAITTLGPAAWRTLVAAGGLPILAAGAAWLITRPRGGEAFVLDHVGPLPWRELLMDDSAPSRTLGRLSTVWLLFGCFWAATDFELVPTLVMTAGWTVPHAGALMLAAAGGGVISGVLAAWLGERWGARRTLRVAALAAGPLALLVVLLDVHLGVWVAAFLLLQVANGAWWGMGYPHAAALFPPRLRGSALTWLTAVFAGGLVIGSVLWTVIGTFFGAGAAWIVVAAAMGAGMAVALLLPQKGVQEASDVAGVVPSEGT